MLLWIGFSMVGVQLASSPAAMVHLEALPPLHSFLDIQFLAGAGAAPPAVAAALVLAILLVRSTLLVIWIESFVRSFGGTPERPANEADDPEAATAVRRARVASAIRRFFPVLALEAGFFLLSVLALFVVAGFFGASFAQIGIIAALLGGMYFFILAPVISVAEGLGVRPSVTLSARAARLPGPRHVLLTFGYISVAIFVSLAVPVSPVAVATPSIAVWIYVLFVGFLHVSVLGAFVYRWLAVRERLVKEPVVRGPEPRGSLR
jgi:hypothetical protein